MSSAFKHRCRIPLAGNGLIYPTPQGTAMANPTRVRLRDTFVLDTAKRTADGYLTASAKVARTGTQTYQGSELGRPDLGDVILFRPENEVFNHDAMHSMAHRPVTLTHPPEMV